MDVHPSQRRFSCQLCRKNKAKCKRIKPDDLRCVRCTLADVICNLGEQKKVGRPKRKEPVSSSTVDNPQATRRPKQPRKPRSKKTRAAVQSKDDNPPPIQDHSCIPGTDQAFTHQYGGDGANLPYIGDSSFVSLSTPTTPDRDQPSWHSLITDLWCQNMLPGAAGGQDLTESGSDSLPYIQTSDLATQQLSRRPSITFAYDSLLPSPKLRDEAFFQGSHSWISPGSGIAPGSSPNSGLIGKKNIPFSLGIGGPPVYYVHDNKFSSDPRDVLISSVGTDGSGALFRLLGIIYGLQLRTTIIQSNRSRLNLNLLISRQGLLSVGTLPLADYVMVSTEELIQIIIILLNNLWSTDMPDGRLSADLVSTIIDIYSRLLSFFQLFLEQLTNSMERVRTDPVIPIAGLTFNNTLVTGPSAQGLLFTSTIYSLLGQLESALGLDSMLGGNGLLSANQIDVLCNKLDKSADLAQTEGIMRPADLKKLYAQAIAVLQRLSVYEQQG